MATKLAEAGVDPIYRADILGHSREGTESDVRYAKTNVAGLLGRIQKIRYPFKLKKWPGLSTFAENLSRAKKRRESRAQKAE